MSNPASDSIVLVDEEAIKTLDLRPLNRWQSKPLKTHLETAACLELRYQWPRDQEDQRELSECPEPRLWALRADGCYPWLPLLLDHDSGNLIQHIAMLVPHQFSQSDGLVFHPQSLEIWISHRLMLLDALTTKMGQPMRNRLNKMAESLGYELDAGFWDLLD
jgi:hypothetical protein